MKKSFSSLAKVFLALLLCCGMLCSLMPAQNASAAKMPNKNRGDETTLFFNYENPDEK